jgi:23S rRNA (guanosine2251-2'-O)-methyltransferase
MRTHRDDSPKHNTDILFGVHPLIEALEAGKEIEKVLMQMGASGPQLGELRRRLQDAGVPIQMVPREKLDSFTRINHQGVVAFISPVSFQPLEEIINRSIEAGREPFLLLLDRVTDVRNFGAICRTAECAGVDAIIIPARGSARIGADALKTSAGALLNIPVCRENNLKDTILMLQAYGILVAGASEKARSDMYSTPLKGPICLIMGSEENGISPEYLKRCNSLIKIPLAGKTGSLNVSVAAGILLYEIIRQRNL